jgi:putative NADPH-quinone reductase
MKKIVAFNGSPRANGNSTHLLKHFLKGAEKHTSDYEQIDTHNLNIEFCRGCLRCNLLGRCSIRGDQWTEISQKIRQADVLVFASPIYFHHVTAQLKKVLDRFRSFIRVELTESGLNHIPTEDWNKDFVLLLSMGSSDDADAKPVVDLFNFLTQTLGRSNKLHTIKGTRLAVSNQIVKSADELRALYPKLKLPESLAESDYYRNNEILGQCQKLGEVLAK